MLDTIVMILFLSAVVFWLYCVFKNEQKRTKAIIDKENEQLALYRDLRDALRGCQIDVEGE